MARSRRSAKGDPVAYDPLKAYEFFKATVGTLRRDWDAFAQLFLDKDRREYLHRTVPTLADCVSTSLTVSIYMGVAQLFDPLISMNDHSKPNLVVRRVIDDIAPPRGTLERDRIESDLAATTPTVELLRQWRNALGAHRSLRTSLAVLDFVKSGRTLPHPVPRIPLMDLRDVLQRLVNITDALEDHTTQGGFLPWYDPSAVREVDFIFKAVGMAQVSARRELNTSIPLGGRPRA